MDLGQRRFLQAEGGHRLALLGQLRQEGGCQLRRRRQGNDPPGLGPGHKSPPSLVISPAGVGRCGAPQGSTDPALVLQGEAGGRQRTGILRKRLNGHLGLVSGQAGGCRKVTR